MFCCHCGTKLTGEPRFCSACGRELYRESAVQRYEDAHNQIGDVLSQISDKERTAGIIWAVVAFIQVVAGLFVNWAILLLGIYNTIAAISRFRQSKKVLEPYPTLVQNYEKSIVWIVIFFIANFLGGAIIGSIGAVFDYMTRQYVLKNRHVLEACSNLTLSAE